MKYYTEGQYIVLLPQEVNLNNKDFVNLCAYGLKFAGYRKNGGLK